MPHATIPCVAQVATTKPSAAKTKLIVLYSTTVPFQTYMDNAPSELHDLGLFRLFFSKWPQSAVSAVGSKCRRR